jgi:hypothetical protein
MLICAAAVNQFTSGFAFADESAPTGKSALASPTSTFIDVGGFIADCACYSWGINGRSLHPTVVALWAYTPPEEVLTPPYYLTTDGKSHRRIASIQARPLDHFPNCATVCAANRLSPIAGCLRVVEQVGTTSNINIPVNAGRWHQVMFKGEIAYATDTAKAKCPKVPEPPSISTEMLDQLKKEEQLSKK